MNNKVSTTNTPKSDNNVADAVVTLANVTSTKQKWIPKPKTHNSTRPELTKIVRPPPIFERYLVCSCRDCSTPTMGRKGNRRVYVDGAEEGSKVIALDKPYNDMCDDCVTARCESGDHECKSLLLFEKPLPLVYRPYTDNELLTALTVFLERENNNADSN